MQLYYIPDPRAVVHGIETVDHIAEIPEHLVADVLANPLWRHLTDDESAALAAASKTVKRAAKKGA